MWNEKKETSKFLQVVNGGLYIYIYIYIYTVYMHISYSGSYDLFIGLMTLYRPMGDHQAPR